MPSWAFSVLARLRRLQPAHKLAVVGEKLDERVTNTEPDDGGMFLSNEVPAMLPVARRSNREPSMNKRQIARGIFVALTLIGAGLIVLDMFLAGFAQAFHL